MTAVGVQVVKNLFFSPFFLFFFFKPEDLSITPFTVDKQPLISRYLTSRHLKLSRCSRANGSSVGKGLFFPLEARRC